MNNHATPLGQRVLTIRTPENIELTYALAGPGSRAAAYLVDFLIMTFAGQIGVNLLIVGASVILDGLGPEGRAWAAAIGGLLFFALYNGYFILFEWLWNGQTPGKRLLHVQVIREGGYALRFFDTLLRNLLRVVDFLPLFYGVGLVSLLLTNRSQRLGDVVAGTLVVYQDPVETDALLAEPEPAPEAEPLPAAAVASIPADLVGIVDVYFRSKDEMVPRPRQEIAADLAALVREASGLAPRVGQSVEGFLASVLRAAGRTAPSSSQPPEEVGLLS